MASALRGFLVRAISRLPNRIPSHGGLIQSEIVKGYRFRSDGVNYMFRSDGYNLDISDQNLKAKFSGFIKLPTDNKLRYPTEDEIKCSAYSVIKLFNDVTKTNSVDFHLTAVLYVIYTKFKSFADTAKLTIMSRVLDVLENYPQVDSTDVYSTRIFIRSMSVDDSKSDLTEKQVISRVLNVVQSYPLVRNHKVTWETHFHNHLGLDIVGRRDIILGLNTEFKLYIAHDIVSCREAMQYVYNYQKHRASLREYRNRLEFIPKSEFDSFWYQTDYPPTVRFDDSFWGRKSYPFDFPPC